MSLDPSAEAPPIGVIETLPAAPEPDQSDDPRTGEPRRPLLVKAATACLMLGVALVAASLLLCYWNAVGDFANASWLMGRFVTTPGSLERVLLAVAVTVIGLVAAVPSAIAGWYAWDGYRWSRIAAVLAAVLSFGMLTVNPVGWVAIGFAVAGAVLLWLPAAGRFFTAWHARRHPEAVLAAPRVEVAYGPQRRFG